MANQILLVQVHDHSLDPAQAELWINVAAEQVTPTTELRGRLAGPRCLYAATVEISYPLRPFSRLPQGMDGLAARVVIPEPSLWEPQCPFVYQGTVELWQGGVCCDQVQIVRGLRHMGIGRGGLRVNGRPSVVRGRSVNKCDEARLAALRRDGCNLLLTATEHLAEWLALADVYGFLVIGRLTEIEQATLPNSEAMTDHPSFLGWVLKGPWDAKAIQRLRGVGAVKIGVELDQVLVDVLPDGVDFIACPAGALADVNKSRETAPLPPLLLLGVGPDSPAAFGRVE